MSEHEFRSGMQLAVADEPPMTFDIDDLMITAERLVRRRRALIAVGTGTAMVAVAAVAVPVVLGISRGPAEIPQAAPPTAVSSATTTPSTPQVPKVEKRTKAQLTARGLEMQAYLKTKFPQVVTGATAVDPGLFGGEAAGAIGDDQNYLSGFVKFTLGAKFAVDVHVQPPGADQTGTPRECAACQQVPQPDGSLLVIEQVDPGADNNKEMKLLSATHFRLDGSITRVTTYNYDPTAQTTPTFVQAPALTVAQLTALATDPALYA